MYTVGNDTADRSPDNTCGGLSDSGLSALYFGVPIEDCSGCGRAATPDELEKGLCTRCQPKDLPVECLEGFDGRRCGEDLACASIGSSAWRRIAGRDVALGLERCPFDVSALEEGLALRGTVIA